MEYQDILIKANKEVDAQLRLLLVTAFAVSRHASLAGRLDKPFNPLLGETFELVDPDGKFKCVCE